MEPSRLDLEDKISKLEPPRCWTIANAHHIKYVGPALHGDALKHGQHGEEDVVERGDSEVRTAPDLLTTGDVLVAEVRTGLLLARRYPVAVRHVTAVAWRLRFALLYDRLEIFDTDASGV